jgi:predicted permease
MVVAEIALAIALVAGAGWLVRSFANLQRADAGFVADKRLVVDILPAQRFEKFEQIVAWSRETLDNLRAVPGVESAATTATFPLRGQDTDSVLYLGIQGEFTDPNHPRVSRVRRVSTSFFETMGIKLLAGRTFTDDDRAETAPVAIVSKTFVRRYLQGHDPLTTTITAGYPTVPEKPVYTIVGVVDDVKYVSMALDADPMYYTPQSQSGYVRQTAVLKTKGDPLSVANGVRDAIHKRDPLMPVKMEPLTSVVAASLVRQRLGLSLMTIFAITALSLAAVGIYGVISYVSSQREAEVATRMALGASPQHVFWLMVGQGRTLSMAGVVAGLAIAYAGGRVVSSRLYEVRALDPLILGGAGAAVLVITAVAVALPARRASRVAPARVLHLD